MGESIPRAGIVPEEVANPRGYYTSSRIVERPNIRFRGIPQEEDEFGEEGLEDEAKAAQSISQKVMQNAQRVLRQIKVKLGTDYQRVPTSEVEEDADIEMGKIDTAQAAETDASDAVNTATQEADVEMANLGEAATEETAAAASDTAEGVRRRRNERLVGRE